MARVEIRNEGTSWCATANPPCNVTLADGNEQPSPSVLGRDTYLGLSVYFPTGFAFEPPTGTVNPRWNVFGEWHHDSGPQTQSPIHLVVDNSQSPPRFSADLYNSTGFVEAYRAFFGNVVYGRWVDFVVRVLWKSDNTGIVEGWMDGVKKFSSGPIRTWNTQYNYVYPMAGFYRDAFASTDVMYVDEFKIGTSYSSVAP